VAVAVSVGVEVDVDVGSAFTVKVALAAEVLETPWPVVTPPTGMELICDPATFDVTFTVTVQAPPAGSEAPLRPTLAPPSAAATVPPVQSVNPFAGVAFWISAG
jgi:hypothetical protein